MAVPESRKYRGLYSEDFALWCEEQARALRDRRWEAVEVAHLAGELDEMSGQARRELGSHLEVLLSHLLKRMFQPEKASKSWADSIEEQALRTVEQVVEIPSLRSQWNTVLVRSYRYARLQAARETTLEREVFPAALTDELQAQLRSELLQAEDALALSPRKRGVSRVL